MMRVSVLCLSLLLSASATFTSLANTWVYRDSNWYYVNSDGVPVIGRFTDEVGDIYTTNAEGACLTGKVGTEVYGQDCRLSGDSVYNQEFEDMAVKYSKGEEVVLPDRSMLHKFVKYYHNQVSLDAQGRQYTGWGYVSDQKLFMRSNTRVNRDDIIRQLILKVGSLEGSSTREKIRSAARKVANSFEYSLDNKLVSIEEFIKSGKGVCWHYARALEEVLQYNGIKAEVVVGYYGGQSHAWVKAWDGESWVYQDPTHITTRGDEYADIPYDVYLKEYRVDNS